MIERKSVNLVSRPNGPPTLENFELVTSSLDEIKDGQVLLKTIYLSLDPYMRGRMNADKSYADPVPVGGVMEGECVAEVIDSKNLNYKVGDIVAARIGWVTHAICDGTDLRGTDLRKIDQSIAPISTALGVLGMPGHTAWTGLNIIGKAKPGETVVVSAATGAVGSVAGQLAKAKGMRVIGVAGGPEKCNFAKSELGYDECFDHKLAENASELRKWLINAAPKGVDVYFENVGGKTTEAVLPIMNDFGRISVCGMISWYSGIGIEEAMRLPGAWREILTKRLQVRGFIVWDYKDEFNHFLSETAPLVQSNQITYRETITDGIENAPQAFLDLLDGKNFGKQLVKVS
jgi:NADPH-dependent curcumin reductase CurA